MAINKTIVQGRLTRDPELRHTPSGKAVGSFTIAWSEKFGDNENKLFLPCVVWDKNAEFIAKNFFKGQEIVAEGRLGSRQWTDKEGNKRETIELTVDRAHFCGPKTDSVKPATEPQQFAEIDDDMGDLPF